MTEEKKKLKLTRLGNSNISYDEDGCIWWEEEDIIDIIDDKQQQQQKQTDIDMITQALDNY